MRRLAVALSLCCVAPLARAQGTSRSAPVFSVDLDVVNLTVSVRDEKGRPVPDLAAEDFSVYEDGRPQAIQLFAPAVEPDAPAADGAAGRRRDALALDLGLLLDTSESMAKEMRLSQEAASRFLEAIPRAHDLLTVFFDHDIRVSRYDSEHQQGLFERILDAHAGGTTALYDAIAVYLSRVQDSSGRKVLVVLTDGEDTTSALSLPELIELVRSSSVTIYPIAFSGAYPVGSNQALSARSFLQRLADLTGGQVFLPRGSRDLPEIYGKILDELSTQYVIGFSSTNQTRDGRYRKLRVEVKRPGLKVRARTGYTAPGSQG